MSKRFLASSFEVSLSPCITCYKLLIRLNQGVYKDFVRAYEWESAAMERLEGYYGLIFMLHVVPEKYGYQSNVIRQKGAVQVRYIDLSPFPITRTFLKLILSFWRDLSSSLQLCSSSLSAFEELSGLWDCFLAIPVPGLETVVKEALEKVRKEQAVLVLIEPNGTLFYRSEEEVQAGSREVHWEWYMHGRYYYLRPGVKRFLDKLQAHPRCVLYFYTSLSNPTCSDLFPRLDDSISYFSADYCDKQVPDCPQKQLSRIWKTSFSIGQGFGVRNTVLVESQYERCGSVKQGLVLMPPYDRHQLVNCQSKVPLQHLYTYLAELLSNSNYDLCAHMEAHPFTSYT